MKYLAVIPARLGSKSIVRKNTKWLHGKPLVQWTLDLAAKMFPETVVTTDDPQIVALARQAGLTPLRRPSWLCMDETPMIEVAQHALAFRPDCDAVVLLQPTQPFRTKAHVLMGLRLFEYSKADSVVSVTPVPQAHSAEWQFRMKNGKLERILDGSMPTRRQDNEPAYVRDGTIYVTKSDTIRAGSFYGDDCVPLVIPARESCNLDEESDWKRAEGMRMPLCP